MSAIGGKLPLGPLVKSMNARTFLPDAFTIGMAALGAVLMVFPSMRVAGLLALLAAAAYWLLMAVVRVVRR